MKHLLLVLTIFSLISCKTEVKDVIEAPDNHQDTLVDINVSDTLDSHIVSDYNMKDVDQKDIKEFKENLVKIEKEFGEQWDFCTCVVKGDSINKAFMSPDLSDEAFDKLSTRFDLIDEKCKAFRIQNPNITPEERYAHEKKVKKCLSNAGIK